MRILLLNPNTSVDITARLAEAAKACAAPTTEIALVTRVEPAEIPITAFLRIVTDLANEGRRTATVLEALPLTA